MSPLAIINPASGGGRCGRAAPRALEALAQRGLNLQSMLTAGPGDASRIAADAYAQGRRTLVVMGGDGTLFEAVNGLPAAAFEDDSLRICIAPLGTGNSLVRDLPTVDLDRAGDDAALDAARAIDLMRVTCRERSFLCANMLSYGFAAAVGRVVNNHLKPLGSLAYSAGVFWMLARLAPHLLPYRLDGGAMRRDMLTLLSVANSRYTGTGMMMAPGARVDDGLMDIITGSEIGRFELVRLFPRIFDGSHIGHRVVRQERAATLEFDFDAPVGMLADGEFIEATPVRIDMTPSALRMAALRMPG